MTKKTAKPAAKESILEVAPLNQVRIHLRLLSIAPMFMNSMSAKAVRDLLLGGGRKTAAQKKEIKHHPLDEYRTSMYRAEDGPTALNFPGAGIKGAMASAGVDTPGITKAAIARNVIVPHDRVPIYGLPHLRCDIVRSADMNKTPDVRTRAYLPRWGTEFDVVFTVPTFDSGSILHLLSNAGQLIGLGDFRQEKGKGSAGRFRVLTENASQDDEAIWQDLVTNESREAQLAEIEAPEPADEFSAEMLAMYHAEVESRSAVVESLPKKNAA